MFLELVVNFALVHIRCYLTFISYYYYYYYKSSLKPQTIISQTHNYGTSSAHKSKSLEVNDPIAVTLPLLTMS